MKKIRLGTRGSELALAQCLMVEQLLSPHISTQRIIIKTVGDRRQDLPLHTFSQEVGDKGAFTKELEEALLADEIDLAVHSLKDVPTELDPRFCIDAVLPRAPHSDLLISKKPNCLKTLETGATVATSSVRRKCFIKELRPDLNITEIRGNVPTRLQKLTQNKALDALVLAEAGLDRLDLLKENGHLQGFDGLHWSRLDPTEFLPAACQGIVGIERLRSRDGLQSLLQIINDQKTWESALLEREFLHLLAGGCETPVGVLTHRNKQDLHFEAVVFSENGGTTKRSSVKRANQSPQKIAKEAYEKLR